jgi:hypothetical protein
VHYNYFEDKPQLTMGDTQIKYMYVYAVIFTTIKKSLIGRYPLLSGRVLAKHSVEIPPLQFFFS